MTESEADVYLRDILNGYLNRKNHLHAVMMASNALKKQIPMKPFVEGDGYAEYYKNLRCVAWQPLPQPYHPNGE